MQKLSLLLLVILCLVRCGFDPTDEDSFEVKPTFSSLWDKTFSNCQECHNSFTRDKTLEGGPSMNSKEQFYQQMVSQKAEEFKNWAVISPDCYSVDFIHKGEPEKSLMLASLSEQINSKFLNDFSPCYSSYRIHNLNQVKLSSSEESAIIEWIRLGAENN